MSPTQTEQTLEDLKDPMEKRGLFQRIADRLFGFDFFISYCWADGRHYAVELQRKLEGHGYNCFLDSSDYVKGDNWRASGRRALKKTSRLILVGTPKAILSEPVANELRIFSGLNRRVFPIDFGGALSGIGTKEGIFQYLDPDLLRVMEKEAALKTGPSEEVLQQIQDSFNLLRQDQKRTRWFAGLTGIFALVAAVAVVFFFVARAETKRANEETKRAMINLSRADFASAKIALENHQINQALFKLWEAYRHAPEGHWRKKSALRLIHAWLPSAGRTIVAENTPRPPTLSPAGRWATLPGWHDEDPDYLIDVTTGGFVDHFGTATDTLDHCSFSPDDSTFALLENNQTLRIMDLNKPHAPFTVAMREAIDDFVLLNANEALIIPSRSNTFYRHDFRSMQSHGNFYLSATNSQGYFADFLFSQNRKKVQVSRKDRFDYWDLDSGKLLRSGITTNSPSEYRALNLDGSVRMRLEHGEGWIVEQNNDEQKLVDRFDNQTHPSYIFHPLETHRIAMQITASQIQVKNLPDETEVSIEPTLTLEHDTLVSSFTFSQNGDQLVVAGAEDTFTIWNIPPQIRDLRERSAISLWGRTYYLSANSNQTFTLIDYETNETISAPFKIPGEYPAHASTPKLSPDGDRLIVSTDEELDGQVLLYDVSNGELITGKPLLTRPATVFFDQSSKHVIAADEFGIMWSWTTEDGAAVTNLVLAENQGYYSYTIKPNSDVFLASERGTVQFWRVIDGVPTLLKHIPTGEEQEAHAHYCTTSHHGDRFAYCEGRDDPTIQIYDKDFNRINSITPPRGLEISHLELSSDGRRIAICLNSKVYVYDCDTGKRLLGPINHTKVDQIYQLAFSPDGETLAISQTIFQLGGDWTYADIQLWDIRSELPVGAPIRRSSDGPKIEFSPDGNELILYNLRKPPMERLSIRSDIPDDDTRLQLTLEVLTGTTFDIDQDRAKLSRAAFVEHRETLDNLGGPVIEFPEIDHGPIMQRVFY